MCTNAQLERYIIKGLKNKLTQNPQTQPSLGRWKKNAWLDESNPILAQLNLNLCSAEQYMFYARN